MLSPIRTLAAALLVGVGTAQNLIFDTDMGFDVDDVGAMSVAHHLNDIGATNLLGTVHNINYYNGIGAASTLDEFYNTKGSLGAYKGAFGRNSQGSQDRYGGAMVRDHPSTVRNFDGVQSNVDAYREMLLSAANNSVAIASVGFPTNLRDILSADRDLFASKVHTVVHMSGSYNFGCGDSGTSGWSPWVGSTENCYGAAQYVVENIPSTTKQVFSLNGGDVCSGSRYNGGNSCSAGPAPLAFRLWTNGGCRSSWDQMAVYYAVYGENTLFSSASAVTVNVDYYGRENDSGNSGKNHWRVRHDTSRNGDTTRIIDDLMCAAPCRDNGSGGCSGYNLVSAHNCYPGRGATDLGDVGVTTLYECQQACDRTGGCEGVVVRHNGQGGMVDCYLKGSINLDACDVSYPSPFDTWTKK